MHSMSTERCLEFYNKR